MTTNPRLLKPTAARLLVEKPKPAPKTTASGIILEVEQKIVEEHRTQEFRDKEIEDEDNLAEMLVIAVGPNVTPSIKPGDKIYIQKYSGFEVEHNSRIYLIGEDHVLATT
jgi:co-chaperonin GroES (HSP10)